MNSNESFFPIFESAPELLTEASYQDLFKKTIASPKNKIATSKIQPGHVIAFSYSAKGFHQTQTLNFYDKMPVVFVTSSDGNYFSGFNIHYVPIGQKKLLLDYFKARYKSSFTNPNPKIKGELSFVPITLDQLKRSYPSKSTQELMKMRDALASKRRKTVIKQTAQKIETQPLPLVQLPGFNYNVLKSKFPFIAQACIHMYIKNLSQKATLLTHMEIDYLCKTDTSKFMFRNDFRTFRRVNDIWKNWQKAKKYQHRNPITSSEPFRY